MQFSDVSSNINNSKKVLLLTGTCGAGKSSLGQLIESKTNYIFIDGDSITRRKSHYERLNPTAKKNSPIDSQGLSTLETIDTMLTVCALGYNVVVGYVIRDYTTLAMYENALSKHDIKPIFRVLVPNRVTCIKRDITRECWTAGEIWVDKFYDEMQNYLISHPSCCIDNSSESLEETYNKHFVELL